MSYIEKYLNRSVSVIADEVKENNTYKRKLITYIAFITASTAIVSLIGLFCINIICMYLSFNFNHDFVFQAVFIPSLMALGLYVLSQFFFAVREWKLKFGGQ